MDTASRAGTSLQEIIDHHDIKKLLSTYCHGCDRADWQRMGSVYGENSWDDHGPYKGPGLDFPEAVMNTFAVNGTKCSHLLGQSQINVDGDRAGAETYFLATIWNKDDTGEDVLTLLGGRYVDTLARQSGQWKIELRVCVRDWSITLDVKKDSLRDGNFVAGLLSGQDPSYAVLGLLHSGAPAVQR